MSRDLVLQYLSTSGDGTGTTNANGDYSSSVTEFYITPSGNDPYNVSRVIIGVEDTSGFQAQEYGNLGSALTNGIEVKCIDEHDRVFNDLTAGIPIKTNAQWAAACFDAELKTWGAGDELLGVRWTFAKAGVPVLLKPGERLSFLLNDDLTGIVAHTFFAQGHIPR
ncbi:MAG: hypothetical protein AB2792_23160 [Candidatus Thiodiazotropha sp.]